MGRARAARRLAAAALYGGGGLGVIGGGAWGLVKAEAVLARRAIGPASIETARVDTTYGTDLPGDPISFAMMGDSAAAGYGMGDPEDTPAGLIAAGLSQIADRPVRVRSLAVVGAQTPALQDQIDLATSWPDPPTVVAIVIGANDVTHGLKPAESVRALDEAVRRLCEHGCEVVVGTCPDLGTIRPLKQPLRQLARVVSRRLAAAQTVAAVEAGARSVSLASLLGEHFTSAPAEFFGADRFHPSGTGYVALATAMLPSVAAACRAWDEDGLGPEDPSDPESGPYAGGTVLPVSFAAARAVEQSGTEVTGTRVAGRDHGPQGRWATALRRRPVRAPRRRR